MLILVNMNSLTILTSLFLLVVFCSITYCSPVAQVSNASDEQFDDFRYQIGSMSNDESQLIRDMKTPLNAQDFRRAKLLTDDNELKDRSSNLLTDPKLFEGDIIGFDSDRNAVKDSEMRWERGRVPYVISEEFDELGRAVIAKAFTDYHKKTCIKFVPKEESDQDYLYIVSGDGCSSFVGRTRGQQKLNLALRGCLKMGIIIHELMHAIGFHHEQSRTDRDQYVQVQWQNIKPGMEHNFVNYEEDRIQSLGVSYDYNSLMHYGPGYFSKNGQATIVPLKANAIIGNRKGFSKKDLEKINKLYQCEID